MGCAPLRGLGQLQGLHVPGGKGTNLPQISAKALPVPFHCSDPQDPAVNRGQPSPGGMILPSSAAHSETKLMF